MNSLLIPWFAFWRRFYGADKGDFPFNRFLGYSLPLGLSLWIAFPLHKEIWQQALYFIALIGSLYIGMSLVKYAKYWNVKTLEDWIMMAVNGMFLMLPTGLVLGFYDPMVGVGVGLSGVFGLPTGYWLSWKIPTIHKKYLKQGTEWGEVLSSGIIGTVAFLESLYTHIN